MPVDHFVANPTALTAIGNTAFRVPGYTIKVLAPAAGRVPAWYTYQAIATTTFGHLILRPDDNPTLGGWYKNSDLVHQVTSKPASAPPLWGITWIASLSTPTRVIVYRSMGTSSVADWVPDSNPAIITSAAPNFTPDYIGQVAVDSVNARLYLADGTTDANNWRQLS